jgi:acetylornithine/N-succinyldiaminopimelate aminotransferase
VCDTIDDELLAGVREREALIRAAFPGVRGRGLLLGLDVDRPAPDVVSECLERGLVICTAGERTLRLTPPLTIATDELERGLGILEEVLA